MASKLEMDKSTYLQSTANIWAKPRLKIKTSGCQRSTFNLMFEALFYFVSKIQIE